GTQAVRGGVKAHECSWTWQRILKASIGQADSRLCVVSHAVVRSLAAEYGGQSGRAAASPAASRSGRAGTALRATDARTIAATGGADCALSGFACGADSRGRNVSRAGGGSGPMGTSASGF